MWTSTYGKYKISGKVAYQDFSLRLDPTQAFFQILTVEFMEFMSQRVLIVPHFNHLGEIDTTTNPLVLWNGNSLISTTLPFKFNWINVNIVADSGNLWIVVESDTSRNATFLVTYNNELEMSVKVLNNTPCISGSATVLQNRLWCLDDSARLFTTDINTNEQTIYGFEYDIFRLMPGKYYQNLSDLCFIVSEGMVIIANIDSDVLLIVFYSSATSSFTNVSIVVGNIWDVELATVAGNEVLYVAGSFNTVVSKQQNLAFLDLNIKSHSLWSDIITDLLKMDCIITWLDFALIGLHFVQ